MQKVQIVKPTPFIVILAAIIVGAVLAFKVAMMVGVFASVLGVFRSKSGASLIGWILVGGFCIYGLAM